MKLHIMCLNELKSYLSGSKQVMLIASNMNLGYNTFLFNCNGHGIKTITFSSYLNIVLWKYIICTISTVLKCIYIFYTIKHILSSILNFVLTYFAILVKKLNIWLILILLELNLNCNSGSGFIFFSSNLMWPDPIPYFSQIISTTYTYKVFWLSHRRIFGERKHRERKNKDIVLYSASC